MALPARKQPPSAQLSLVRPFSDVPRADAFVAGASGDSPSAVGDPVQEWQDAELVALARAGDRRAFEGLYRKHGKYALSLAVRVQGNATDVEDILHDAFLRIHGRLDHLRSGDAFRPWLAKVVVSLVRSRMRRRRVRRMLGLSDVEAIDLDALSAPQASPETRAQLAEVYGSLRSVTLEQRICWVLRYVEGRKLEDVAQLADCSLATAKRRIAAVQQHLMAVGGAQRIEADR